MAIKSAQPPAAGAPGFNEYVAELAQKHLDEAVSGFNEWGTKAVKTLKNIHATPNENRIALANIREICRRAPHIAALKNRRDQLSLKTLTVPVPLGARKA